MTFKKRTDAVSRSYWEFVERTAKEVQNEMPAWAKKDAAWASGTSARSEKTRSESSSTKKIRAKVS
jgi:hypothetical protein